MKRKRFSEEGGTPVSEASWIFPFQGRNHSLGTKLNLLWQYENVYVMDNHLAAAWCWLQHDVSNDIHSVIHIDAHYDTAASSAELLNISPEDLRELGFDEYRNLSITDGGKDIPFFRWDNYLTIYENMFGGLVEEWVFSTHGIGTKPTFNIIEIAPNALRDRLSQVCDTDQKLILNLDLDFFVSPEGDRFPAEERPQIFEILGTIAQQHSRVVTIALSPECCGSWESSESVMEEVRNIFQLPFELPQ